MPRDFVGRDDLGAPNVASVSRRGAHCAPGGLRAPAHEAPPADGRTVRARDFGLYRFAKLLIHNCVFAACAAALRTRRGQPDGFPLLANQPLSLRARCARKSKCSLPVAAHFPYQGKQNGCHPRGAGAQCAPLRQAERCVPVGGVLPFLLLLESGRRKVWRYAPRARSAPLFAAANAANLRVGLNCLLSPKRKWGDPMSRFSTS